MSTICTPIEPTSKTSSSSASSVEVSDDEEDEEDFDMDLGNSRMCIDKGNLSKLNSEESSNISSESDIDELNDLPKEKFTKLTRNYNSKCTLENYHMLPGNLPGAREKTSFIN